MQTSLVLTWSEALKTGFSRPRDRAHMKLCILLFPPADLRYIIAYASLYIMIYAIARYSSTTNLSIPSPGKKSKARGIFRRLSGSKGDTVNLKMLSASCKCLRQGLISAYRKIVWILIRLLLEEQSDLGQHCLLQQCFEWTSRRHSR